MNIMFQTTGSDAYSINGKINIPNNIVANITRALLMKSSHNKYFFALPISIPYGPPAELGMDCVVMFLTSSDMEQDLHNENHNMGCESQHHQWKCHGKES